MDRNEDNYTIVTDRHVAPLAGSVDRNPKGLWMNGDIRASLPSRGAWIEITLEGKGVQIVHRSLPSRGAWIEMILMACILFYLLVAPLAGSVDRNVKGLRW